MPKRIGYSTGPEPPSCSGELSAESKYCTLVPLR